MSARCTYCPQHGDQDGGTFCRWCGNRTHPGSPSHYDACGSFYSEPTPMAPRGWSTQQRPAVPEWVKNEARAWGRVFAFWLAVFVAVILLLALIIAVTPSNAATFNVPPAPEVQQLAHDLALAHWGAEPCGGNVAITWEHLGSTMNAHSNWVGNDPNTYAQCAVQFNLDVAWTWDKYCTVAEHESGHLTGHPHDDGVLMNPYYIGPTPECATVVKGSAQPLNASRSTTHHLRYRASRLTFLFHRSKDQRAKSS